MPCLFFPCHFDPFGQAQGKLREKSFLNPSHSLVIMGFARHSGGTGTTVPHVLQVRSFSSLENFW